MQPRLSRDPSVLEVPLWDDPQGQLAAAEWNRPEPRREAVCVPDGGAGGEVELPKPFGFDCACVPQL